MIIKREGIELTCVFKNMYNFLSENHTQKDNMQAQRKLVVHDIKIYIRRHKL
jgi:hypothetical protein